LAGEGRLDMAAAALRKKFEEINNKKSGDFLI
jgi:hypothetical protein